VEVRSAPRPFFFADFVISFLPAVCLSLFLNLFSLFGVFSVSFVLSPSAAPVESLFRCRSSPSDGLFVFCVPPLGSWRNHDEAPSDFRDAFFFPAVRIISQPSGISFFPLCSLLGVLFSIRDPPRILLCFL